MRILIADDHTLFRRGLRLLLSMLFPEAEIIEASDAAGALAASTADPVPDVVLCDLTMPGMAQLAGLAALREARPDMPVVMLSANPNPDDIVRCIEAGAHGYILKSANDATLRHAISLVLDGETYLPSEAFLDGQRRWIGGRIDKSAAEFPPDNPLAALTDRQRDVLTLLMVGQSNKEIARKLGLLESTVKAHVKVILDKLAATNRTQAAMLAAELGWPPSRTPAKV